MTAAIRVRAPVLRSQEVKLRNVALGTESGGDSGRISLTRLHWLYMSVTLETPSGAAQGRSSDAARADWANGGDAGQLPFAFAIFVSAFLLFQVQLLLGKVILPLFGGAPAVWTVCVFVFQLLFLAGYGYSHGLATWLPIRKQVIAHSVLLGGSAIFIALPLICDPLRLAPVRIGNRSPGTTPHGRS